MVSIFTGLGTGFERGSGTTLGSSGLLGSGTLGRSGEQVSLNAATGNLLISQRDDWTVTSGIVGGISRTYNSLGNMSDDNGDNWRQSTDRRIFGLTGTVNTVGSTVKRRSADGTESVYRYSASASAYVSTDGGGAYDKLVGTADRWIWTDGATQASEQYYGYSASDSLLLQETDAKGNATNYSYSGGRLAQVSNLTGWMQYTWSGNNITQILAGFWDSALGAGATSLRTRYGYDASNRLTTVTTDLSPRDLTITDGNVYVTTYGYDGASTRISSISETDGSQLAISYDAAGRVASWSQTVSTGVIRTTTIAYGATATTITDPAGQVTTLDYNSDNSLKKITSPPAYAGAPAQVVQFTYNANGDVLSIIDAQGLVSSFTYDDWGNVLTSTDPLGNVVTRTYGTKNEVLTETRTGADSASSASAHTTRYVYDEKNRLIYVVDAEGRVTRNDIDATGNATLVQRYTEQVYDLSALAASTALTKAQLSAWEASISDKSNVESTRYTYDGRGHLTQAIAYASANAAGVPNLDSGYLIGNYIYDQAGELLSRALAGHGTERFVYDGLGRIIASTDMSGAATSFLFNDSAMQTVVTLANGLVQTSVYNKAGELVSYTESGANVVAGTATYAYDQRGQLRVTTDATGKSSYIIYDKVGRKVGDVDAYGALVEYRYDADNRLVATIRHDNVLTAQQITSLKDPLVFADIGALRPAANSADIWTWHVYDADGRTIETIAGDCPASAPMAQI